MVYYPKYALFYDFHTSPVVKDIGKNFDAEAFAAGKHHPQTEKEAPVLPAWALILSASPSAAIRAWLITIQKSGFAITVLIMTFSANW